MFASFPEGIKGKASVPEHRWRGGCQVRFEGRQKLSHTGLNCCMEENTGCCGGHGKLLQGGMVLNEKVGGQSYRWEKARKGAEAKHTAENVEAGGAGGRNKHIRFLKGLRWTRMTTSSEQNV